jgi:hypothetical protein
LLILELVEAGPGQQTRYSIVEADLHSSVEYGAVSYTWAECSYYDGKRYVWKDGPPSTLPMVVDQCDFEVTVGLYRLLQRLAQDLSRDNRVSRLWADQICINQRDMLERSQQVAMMGDIYRLASRTFIWLGEPDEYTPHFLELVHAISSPPFNYNERIHDGLLGELTERVKKVLSPNSGRQIMATQS